MLRISLVDGQHERRIIVEGTLVALWADELATACQRARADIDGRELIVDLRGLTAISPEGESVLLRLMRDKIKFQCGLFMSEVLKQLARKSQRKPQNAADAPNEADSDGSV